VQFEVLPVSDARRVRESLAALTVFAIDVFACPRCGGRRRLVGVHPGGEHLQSLLERLGLGSASPAAKPSRSPPCASQQPDRPLRRPALGPGVRPRLPPARSGVGRVRLYRGARRRAGGKGGHVESAFGVLTLSSTPVGSSWSAPLGLSTHVRKYDLSSPRVRRVCARPPRAARGSHARRCRSARWTSCPS